jgi:hypothetical protein
MISAKWMEIMNIPGMAWLISLLLGFGVAALFRPICKGPDCVIMRGPPVDEIRGAVYQFGSKCVEFTAKPVECPADKTNIVSTIAFANFE